MSIKKQLEEVEKRIYEKKYPALSEMTIAEKTVYWFLHGKRYCDIPNHINCRCSVIPINKEA